VTEPHTAVSCFLFSLNITSHSVASDESYVTSKETHVSTASPRYLYNDISCLGLIDIFKTSRQKFMKTQGHLCSSKKLINDYAISGTCGKYMKESFFELWKEKKSRVNGIFLTLSQFLTTLIYVLHIQYFKFVKKKLICPNHQTVI